MGAIAAARGQDAAAPKEPLQAARGNKATVPGIYKQGTQPPGSAAPQDPAEAAAVPALLQFRQHGLED
jgi:hypothetical protein